MMMRTYTVVLLAVLLGACSASKQVAVPTDNDTIMAQMHANWDRPEAPLEAGPIAIAGNFAVADWTQGKAGGRALMRRDGANWITVLCAGDGIRDADGLIAAGVSVEDAKLLADRLARAETAVSEKRLARMSAFLGIVRMDGPNDGGAQAESADRE